MREAIEFAAALRLPATISDDDRKAYVEHIIHIAELVHITHKSLEQVSPGQAKRVKIAVEMAGNPSVLLTEGEAHSLMW